MEEGSRCHPFTLYRHDSGPPAALSAKIAGRTAGRLCPVAFAVSIEGWQDVKVGITRLDFNLNSGRPVAIQQHSAITEHAMNEISRRLIEIDDLYASSQGSLERTLKSGAEIL